MQYQPNELGSVSCQVRARGARKLRRAAHVHMFARPFAGVRCCGVVRLDALGISRLSPLAYVGHFPALQTFQYDCDDVDSDLTLGSFRYVQLQEMWEVQEFIRRYAG